MFIDIRRKSELNNEEVAALGVLNRAVYPPEVVADWPGRAIEWSPPGWQVLVWNQTRTQVLAHAGLLVRPARHNERGVNIGGIGGVMTHPEYRRQGYAAAALGRCLEFFREQGDIDFAMLVCNSTLVPVYQRLGWQRFSGELFVTQQGTRAAFHFNLPMTHGLGPAGAQAVDGISSGELTGTIDLLGPPW